MIGLTALAARVLEAPLALRRDTRGGIEPLDAIVVLGAPLMRDGTLTQILVERVAAAAELYHAGGAPLVIASGGTTHGAPRAEAEALAEALREAGVPDVIVEGHSKSTLENARFTAQVLSARGARRVWIVTQPFHSKRAALLFRRAGLEPTIWHIEDSVQYRDRRRALRWLVREWASWGVMLLRRR